MATTAPENTTSDAPGWLDPFLADWRPGTGEPREDPRARLRPAAADADPVDARRRRARRRHRRRGPAGLGRYELRGAGRDPPSGGR